MAELFKLLPLSFLTYYTTIQLKRMGTTTNQGFNVVRSQTGHNNLVFTAAVFQVLLKGCKSVVFRLWV